jgi:hypothetical protein
MIICCPVVIIRTGGAAGAFSTPGRRQLRDSPHVPGPASLRHSDGTIRGSRGTADRFTRGAQGIRRTMHIRRPVAGLFIALTLFGGGGVALMGCDPASNTGTPADTATNTSGASGTPAPEQQNIPDNSNREPSSSDTSNDIPGNG